MMKIKEDMQFEANKCYMCKNARCRINCPIDTPIPEVINLFKKGEIDKAGRLLFENNPLSVVCGIVCPHEIQCKGNCIRGIKDEPVNFCDIEVMISDYFLQNNSVVAETTRNERIAIIGGGPAGLTIAFILAKRGYKITILESNEKIGGVLRYGIPEFRLPNRILDNIEKRLIELNVKIRPNTLIGPVLTIDKLLFDGYDAVFIGTGVWNPKSLNIKGESLGNAHYAIDYLKSPSIYNLGNKVCVIGAGNVAMDAARTAKRQGAEEVYILYRKGFENMPATKAELQEAIEDGVKFELFKAPIEITDNGVKYVETRNEVADDGRVTTVTLEDTENIFECTSTIIAVSQSPKNNIVSNTEGLQTNKWGLIVTDKFGHTTKEGVFASGDVVTGADTVVKAVANAKIVAEQIHTYIKNRK